MKKSLTILFSLFSLGACTSVPESLQVNTGTNLVSYQEVMQASINALPKGQTARWSGVVVDVSESEGATELEIMYSPKGIGARPSLPRSSQYRFKAFVNEPDIAKQLQAGALVTVLGAIGDAKQGLVGERVYTYPTLNSEAFYVWGQQPDALNVLDLSHTATSPWIAVPEWRCCRFEQR